MATQSTPEAFEANEAEQIAEATISEDHVTSDSMEVERAYHQEIPRQPSSLRLNRPAGEELSGGHKTRQEEGDYTTSRGKRPNTCLQRKHPVWEVRVATLTSRCGECLTNSLLCF